MTEDRTIKFIKDVLLNGNNPRGKDVENNLRWGLQEYLKEQLKLYGVVVPKEKLKTKPERKLGDYDVWYKPCERCGYDNGKCPKPMDNKKCWRCGNRVDRDFTDRALKK